MAVNNLGVYQLSDMWDRVWRAMAGVTFNVDQTTGAESNYLIQDQSVSSTEITNQINESLMRLYCELVEANGAVFAKTVVQAVEKGNVGPYGFPFNMFTLRWMKWRMPGQTNSGSGSGQHHMHWHPMVEISDPNDESIKDHFDAPTWRWEGDQFFLNTGQWNWGNNDGAVMINFTSFPSELSKPTDVITVPARFVRVMQQAVIYDAATMLSATKKRNVQPEIKENQQMWHQRALVAVLNVQQAQSIQTIAPDRMTQNTFSGKWHRRSGRGRWW